MGLAILPSRLKEEMEVLADAIVTGKNIRDMESIEKHAEWVEQFLPEYTTVNKDNIMDILQKEIGIVFMKVLEDAGVYKRTEEGQKAFDRFCKHLSI